MPGRSNHGGMFSIGGFTVPCFSWYENGYSNVECGYVLSYKEVHCQKLTKIGGVPSPITHLLFPEMYPFEGDTLLKLRFTRQNHNILTNAFRHYQNTYCTQVLWEPTFKKRFLPNHPQPYNKPLSTLLLVPSNHLNHCCVTIENIWSVTQVILTHVWLV
jgi:hypothetical protein